MFDDYEIEEWANLIALVVGPALCWAAPFGVAYLGGYWPEALALFEQSTNWSFWYSIPAHFGVALAGSAILFMAFAIGLFFFNIIWSITSVVVEWLYDIVTEITEFLVSLLKLIATKSATIGSSIAVFLLSLFLAPFSYLIEKGSNILQKAANKRRVRRDKRAEMWRAYMDHYHQDFRSFRAFKKYVRATEQGKNPRYPGEKREKRQKSRKPKQEKPKTGQRRKEQKRRQDPPPHNDPPRATPYGSALMMLGLSEPFNKADLNRAFKAKMKTAHPDLGGDERQAQRLNIARELIMKQKGWS